MEHYCGTILVVDKGKPEKTGIDSQYLWRQRMHGLLPEALTLVFRLTQGDF